MRDQVIIQRDCDAIQIPDGTPVHLPAGTAVTITQALGGTYTVLTPYGLMVRIDEKHADAIGQDRPADAGAETAALPLEERVWAQMKKCYDPEIPVNIVDLGLVYDCKVTAADEGRSRVEVKMTLTAPGCGMGDVLAVDVKRRIEELAGVAEADVEVVFDPQWTVDMMSEAARLELGLF
jgi:probable FeS assembly SUF system protein SufT